MNRLERLIYEFVKDRPVLKRRIVDAYQGALSLIPQRNVRASVPMLVREGYWVGFHDKTPFSSDGRLLLAHRALIDERPSTRFDEVEVGFFGGNDWRDYQPLSRTRGWTWLMGAMLQWVGGNRLVFNTVDRGRPGAQIMTTTGEVAEELDHPVVHTSADGRFFCTYDFHRVEVAMPGYGIIAEDPVPTDDPTSRFAVLERSKGEPTFELSLKEARSISPHPSMEGAFHFFHHALFSPDGRRVFFMHRWVEKSSRRRWTRLFSVSPSGAGLYLFPMDEMVSHVTWASAAEIFGYMRYPGLGDGYFLVRDEDGAAKQYFADVLNSDGHPTMDRQRGFVITDTYPDRFRNQYLVLGDLATGTRIDVCRTHLPKIFSHDRQLDLHPRLHPTENIVCVDSGHTGRRSVVTLDVTALLS